jgi:DMSO/TMAO reductase YedYZ heme-binding membrane subunit
MNHQVWWHLARSSGIVAWALLALSVMWGLLLSTRALGRKPSPPWLLDLHRFLGGLAVVFTGLHIAGLVADSYVHFGVADVLVPMASGWKPGPVALGVVALWLLLAVEVSSLMMRRLPRAVWRRIHMASFALFVVAGLHGSLAGTDAANAVYRDVSVALILATLLLTLVRIIVPRRARRARSARSPGQPAARSAALRSVA